MARPFAFQNKTSYSKTTTKNTKYFKLKERGRLLPPTVVYTLCSVVVVVVVVLVLHYVVLYWCFVVVELC